MSAGEDKQSEPLARYSKGMYGCIVDNEGSPYFIYDPEA